MTVRGRLSPWVLALAPLMLAGCDGDATGPGIFDPALTAEAMHDMEAAGDEVGEAFVSLSLAGSLFDGSTAAAMMPSSERGLLMDESATRLYAASVGPFFPSNYLGVTFVWSFAEQRYVPSEETGAPTDGIRVVYYAVDPTTEAPAEPLNALGYIDLRDLSGAASQRLGVQVVRTTGGSNTTLADYYLDASYSSTATELSVRQQAEGYLSNGTDRLDFDLVNDASFTETDFIVEQAYEMALAGTDVRVTYDGVIALDWETETGSITISATVAGHGSSVRFELSSDGETLEGGVYHGDRLVATISGTGDAPVFTNAETGEELTAEQLEHLAGIFHSVERMFELAAGLFPGA